MNNDNTYPSVAPTVREMADVLFRSNPAKRKVKFQFLVREWVSSKKGKKGKKSVRYVDLTVEEVIRVDDSTCKWIFKEFRSKKPTQILQIIAKFKGIKTMIRHNVDTSLGDSTDSYVGTYLLSN